MVSTATWLAALLLLLTILQADARVLPSEQDGTQELVSHARALKQYKKEYVVSKEKQDKVYLAYGSPTEEAFEPKPASAGKVIAWFQWSNSDKVIKYVVLGVHGAPLTATTFGEIRFVHLHVGAPRHQNASNPIDLPLEGSGSQKIGFSKTPDGYPVLARGYIDDQVVKTSTVGQAKGITTAKQLYWDYVGKKQTYVNLHTAKFPDGEIRGQIDWPELSAFQSEAGKLAEKIKVVTKGKVVDNYYAKPSSDRWDERRAYDRSAYDRSQGRDGYEGYHHEGPYYYPDTDEEDRTRQGADRFRDARQRFDNGPSHWQGQDKQGKDGYYEGYHHEGPEWDPDTDAADSEARYRVYDRQEQRDQGRVYYQG